MPQNPTSAGAQIELDDDFSNQTFDIGADGKKSQVSIVIKQEKIRSGLMSFMRDIEDQSPTISSSTSQSSNGSASISQGSQGNY